MNKRALFLLALTFPGYSHAFPFAAASVAPSAIALVASIFLISKKPRVLLVMIALSSTLLIGEGSGKRPLYGNYLIDSRPADEAQVIYPHPDPRQINASLSVYPGGVDPASLLEITPYPLMSGISSHPPTDAPDLSGKTLIGYNTDYVAHVASLQGAPYSSVSPSAWLLSEDFSGYGRTSSLSSEPLPDAKNIYLFQGGRQIIVNGYNALFLDDQIRLIDAILLESMEIEGPVNLYADLSPYNDHEAHLFRERISAILTDKGVNVVSVIDINSNDHSPSPYAKYLSHNDLLWSCQELNPQVITVVPEGGYTLPAFSMDGSTCNNHIEWRPGSIGKDATVLSVSTLAERLDRSRPIVFFSFNKNSSHFATLASSLLRDQGFLVVGTHSYLAANIDGLGESEKTFVAASAKIITLSDQSLWVKIAAILGVCVVSLIPIRARMSAAMRSAGLVSYLFFSVLVANILLLSGFVPQYNWILAIPGLLAACMPLSPQGRGLVTKLSFFSAKLKSTLTTKEHRLSPEGKTRIDLNIIAGDEPGIKVINQNESPALYTYSECLRSEDPLLLEAYRLGRYVDRPFMASCYHNGPSVHWSELRSLDEPTGIPFSVFYQKHTSWIEGRNAIATARILNRATLSGAFHAFGDRIIQSPSIQLNLASLLGRGLPFKLKLSILKCLDEKITASRTPSQWVLSAVVFMNYLCRQHTSKKHCTPGLSSVSSGSEYFVLCEYSSQIKDRALSLVALGPNP